MRHFPDITRLNDRSWCSIAFICCALIASGCGSSTGSHEEEHEHLEHFVPAHKPTTFSNLVEQLALRTVQLKVSSQAGSSDDGSRAAAVQEFSDIIGWIPELAADSELMKADFESAVVTGSKLATAFSDALGRQTTKSFDAAALEPLIDELSKLAPKSLDRKDQL